MSYFKRVSDFKDEIIRDKVDFGIRGWKTGIPAMDEIISFVKGYSTLVFSYAHHGKTQIVLDNCLFLAREYGVKSALYLTEAGKKSQAVLDIIGTLVGKQVPEITDEELAIAIDFVDKYFFFGDVSDKLLDIDQVYKEVDELKKEGVNIENVVIDHFHQLENSPEQKFMDRADKTKYVLRTVNKMSRKLNIHSFIMFHVRDTTPIQCKESKHFFLPLPEKEDISGGQQASYLAFNMVCIWRPVMKPENYGIVDRDGVPYELNESVVYCAKVKPKGSATLGQRRIFFDVSTQRYYSLYNGKRIYAVDSLTSRKKEEIPPNPQAGITANKSFEKSIF